MSQSDTGYLSTRKETTMNRVQELKQDYNLQKHIEGGWFCELYTAPFKADQIHKTDQAATTDWIREEESYRDRPLAGSIYFLLDRDDISQLHQLDCDEIWYYHEGCGMIITMLRDGKKEEYLLGMNKGQSPMLVIPAGTIFGAENIDKDSYTFISCMTTPAFRYEGFRLV